jgi:hypothetical protein
MGPPPPPQPPLSTKELVQRIEWWLEDEAHNRGIFDADPEFRPAWSHYHDLWQSYTHGYSPLAAVWLRRAEPDFEEARRRVVEIMMRVARKQLSPVKELPEILECLEKDFARAMGVGHESTSDPAV